MSCSYFAVFAHVFILFIFYIQTFVWTKGFFLNKKKTEIDFLNKSSKNGLEKSILVEENKDTFSEYEIIELNWVIYLWRSVFYMPLISENGNGNSIVLRIKPYTTVNPFQLEILINLESNTTLNGAASLSNRIIWKSLTYNRFMESSECVSGNLPFSCTFYYSELVSTTIGSDKGETRCLQTLN